MHFVEAKELLSSQNRMNIYRGCTHGCIYCDSRSRCYQIKHPFEDVEVKENAPELLEGILQRKRKACMIGTGSMSDPYMHCEKELGLTRRCLELIDYYNFGVSLLTKSSLVLRDLDILRSINEKTKAVVQMTLTTFDEELCKKIEPNTSTTRERYEVLKIMQENGIPTVVWITPILPFINDTEENLRGILDMCFDVGVKGIVSFGIGTTMRDGSRDYFFDCLDREFPGIRKKYVERFGYSTYDCPSDNSEYLMGIFHEECEKHGVLHDTKAIFEYLQEFPEIDDGQLSLF